MAVVGITSRSSEKDLEWLMEFIRLEFWEHVSNVKYLPITNRNTIEWEQRVSRCSVGILYHTKRHGRLNITNVDGALYDEELQLLCTSLGRSKVLVVLDDLEDCSDSERQRILTAQPSLTQWSSQILLFPERRKYEEAHRKKGDFLHFFYYNTTAAKELQVSTSNSKSGWISSLSSFLSSSSSSSDKSSKTSSVSKQDRNLSASASNIIHRVTSPLKIYIFSRAAESNYAWLIESLKTTYWIRSIDVRGVYITNKSTSFYSALPHCSFAILYHTKKQGRLNLTDVTDSMYDEELKDLSEHLGKENVIVVIDDLKNTDSSEKSRILESQPSIGRLAKELFLFDERKKNTENLEKIKEIIAKKAPKDYIMHTDYPQKSYGGKSDESRKSAKHPGHDHYQNMVDHQPSLGRKYDESSKSVSCPDQDHDQDMEDLQHSYGRKSGESRKSKAHQNHHQDMVDLHLSSPWSSLATCSKERELPTAGDVTWRYTIDSEGPETKKLALDLSALTYNSNKAVTEVNNTLKEAFRKWQNCEKIVHKGNLEMTQEIQRLQQENKELQSKNINLHKDISEHEKVKEQILEINSQLIQDKARIVEERDTTTQKMKQKIQELQKKLTDKEDTQLEKSIQVIQNREQTIAKLHKHLSDKDETIEENPRTIQMTEQRNQEEKKRREKEELQRDEENIRKETQLIIEKLRNDLSDKERTIEENHRTIQMMEQKILHLQKYNNEIENKTKQEEAGEHQNYGEQPKESQQYTGRRIIPGQEDDRSQRENRTCSQEHQSGHMMDGGSVQHRAHSDIMEDQWQSSTEEPNLRSPENVLIEELRGTIQQKDEEIQNLEIKIQKLNYNLEENVTLISDLLTTIEIGKEKE